MPEDLPRMPYGENFRSPDWKKDNQRTRDPNHQATRDRGGGYLLPVSLFPTIGGPMQSANGLKVFVLKEEVDVVGVFTSEESALKCARECELFNFTIEEFTVTD